MLSIAIVDDDPMVMEINRQYAAKISGTRVIACFRNGREAWEFLRNNRVDLILMDLYMPEMTGLELLRKLRSAGHPADVIMVTADNSLRDIKEALNLGITDYLIKPFEFSRFRQAVEKCITKKALTDRERSGSDTLSQQELDLILRGDAGEMPAANNISDKGIQATTLDKLIQCLAGSPDADMDCETLAASSGLSKVTVRRYMNYLIENDQAESVIDYNTGGRPAIRYRIRSGSR